MDKKILITSVNKYHKKNFKYLDYGSLNIRNDSSPDDILFNHPWNNFNDYLKDIKKIEKIYIVILNKYLKLNQHFKIKKFEILENFNWSLVDELYICLL